MKEIYNIEIEEWVEARVWQNCVLKETHIFKGNTVTGIGKTELAQLVGGLDSKTIDYIWAKIDGVLQPRTSNNSTGNTSTLTVQTSSAYTASGNYTAVFTGNNAVGSLSYYNSIAVSFTLPTNSEVDFVVKWAFSGSSESGNQICAARLGHVGGQFDQPIGTITVWPSGAGPGDGDSVSVTNAVSNNTLNVTHASAFNGPKTVNLVYYEVEPSGSNFDKFQGLSVEIGTGQDFYFEADFIFG